MAARALGGCTALYESNRVLALGQFISLLIALTGVFTQTLNQSFQVRTSLIMRQQALPTRCGVTQSLTDAISCCAPSINNNRSKSQ